MLVSTIIPTIGRASLARAVQSVLAQDFQRRESEVIVVNDSGKPLLTEDWMHSQHITILHTDRHNRSVARNTGAAVARGKYLHFLDDDDWMLPGAFWSLSDRAINSPAGWIYGGFQLVHHSGENLRRILPTVTGNSFIQMIAAEWIPLQASWIDANAFFLVGGFAPLNSLDGGYEDIDLSRLIARLYNFDRVTKTVAVIRFGDEGSTTDYGNSFNQNWISKEKNLDAADAFQIMMRSAKTSPYRKQYWQGKIAYYYLGSILWNLKRKRIMKALSRLTFALLTFGYSLPYLFSSEFWKGAINPHSNLVRTAMIALDKKIYSKTIWR